MENNDIEYFDNMVYTYCPKCGHISATATTRESIEYEMKYGRKCDKCKEKGVQRTDVFRVAHDRPCARNIPAIKKSFEIKRKIFKEIIEPLGQLDTNSIHYRDNYRYLFEDGEEIAIRQAEQHMEEYKRSETQDKVVNVLTVATLIAIGIAVIIFIAGIIDSWGGSSSSSSKTCSCGKRYNTTYGMCEDCYEDFKYAKDFYEDIAD
ncbi:MAG: hypothetical protein IJB57_09165 [Clostridia bacterium]|nr:hypothetical protein [Clostridia bacterium]